MNKSELERILAEQLPGYEVVEEVASDAAPEGGEGPLPTIRQWGRRQRPGGGADSVGQDRLASLRKRFLGDSAAPSAAAPAPDAAEPESTMVMVKPKGKDARAKAVIIEKGRIVGRQG